MTTSDTGHTDPLLPYQEVTDPSYAEQALRQFTVEQPAPGIRILRGPCPRCAAVIDVPVVDSVFKATGSLRDLLRRRPAPSATSHVEPIICLCADPHPNRPEGRTGCGAYWTLVVSTPAR